LLALLLPGIAVAAIAFNNSQPRERLVVLLYHGVKATPYYEAWHDNSIIMHRDRFYEHMRYLYDNDFNIITAAQFEAWYHHGSPLPPNAVMLHFDDANVSDYWVVAPILRQFGFTAVNFVIGEMVSAESLPMHTTELRHMSREQMEATRDVFEFASHSNAMHRGSETVAGMSQAQVRADFLVSQQAFEMCLTNWFAFPYGAFTTDAVEALRAENVNVSWSTRQGYVRLTDCNMTLPRFPILAGSNNSGYGMTAFSRILRGRSFRDRILGLTT